MSARAAALRAHGSACRNRACRYRPSFAGNYHSDALKVTERYTLKNPHVMQYEAVIEDPKVFTRTWTIHMPIYRRVGPDARLQQFKCVEFVEELLYGHLRKEPLEAAVSP